MGIIPVDNNKGNSVTSVDTVDFSQFTNPAANAEKGLAMAEAMDFDFGEILDEVTTEVKESVSTEELAQAREQNGPEIDPTQLTEDDIKALVGNLSPEEYDKFIGGVEDYYDEQVKILEGLLKTEDHNGLEDMYNDLLGYTTLMTNKNVGDMYSKTRAEYYEKQYLETLQEKYGVTDYASVVALQNETKAKIDEINEAIKMSKNLKDSAKYDYLAYLGAYDKYNEKSITNDALNDLDKYIDRGYTGGHWREESGNIQIKFLYNDYVKDHPDVNPAEFVQMLEEKYAGKDYTIDGISNVEDLKTLSVLNDKFPDLLKKYNYLYNEDPQKAEQYMKDIKYQINNFRGQLEAEEFLEILYSKDEEEALKILSNWASNELGVHVEGIGDGLVTFGMGVYHAGEAGYTGAQTIAKEAGWYDGEIYENRTMDVSEYKKMYILQALMSKEDKIKSGVLNEDGTAADPNAIIDFTKEYEGHFLQNNYEISQGIGNMLPSVMISMVNPGAGAWAMGISAGGNAYHGAMVEGNSYVSSLIYGGLTGSSEAISQRILGGLPGLNEVPVYDVKSLLNAMRMEGNQEMFQGVFDLLIRHDVLGEPLPQNWEDLKDTGLDILKQGAYGAITAGYMQVPSLISGQFNINRFNSYMQENKVSIEEYKKAIEEIRNINNDFASLDEKGIQAKHTELLKTKVEVGRIKGSNDTGNVTKSILDSLTTTDQIKSLQSKLDEGINIDDASLQVLTEAIKSNKITIESGEKIFKEMVGEKLASWSPDSKTSYQLLSNLMLSCDRAGVTTSQLRKSLDLMESVENYYDKARKLDVKTGGGIFETYRTHGIVHIFDVLTQSINAYSAMKGAGFEQLDLDTIMLTAVMHDTGMSGGKQIHLDVVDGKLVISTTDVQSNGTSIRESHSFNSGVDIINEAAALKEAGYEDYQIAEAALLAFAHSKSNSGLNPLADNPAGWSFAIQALQEATKDSDFKIVDELIKAGIILEKGATKKSKNEIEVKCPKTFKESNHIIELDDEGKPIKDGKGGKTKGIVDTYTFNQEALDRMAYEALAVRIGDALTNNDNAKMNQYFGEITFKNTKYKNQYNTIQVLEAMSEEFTEAIKDSECTVQSMPTKDNIISTLLQMEDGLQDAGFAETKHGTDKNSVIYEVEGKNRNDSQPFVLGENNQTYEVKTNKDGEIEVVVRVKNSNAVPFCTLFAIQERAGELLSLSESSNEMGIKYTIEIDPRTKSDIKELYQQYVDHYKDNKVVTFNLKDY